MTYGEFEFEYLHSEDPQPEPARTHPDPSQAAWLYVKCRDFSTRRFALATARGSRYETLKWQGLQHSGGRATIWTSTGRLVGSYRSVDTACHRLAKGNLDLYLVWLDPKPPLTGPDAGAQASARLELRNNGPQAWTVTLGYTAFGPHGARLIAMDIAQGLDKMLPGFDRGAVAIRRAGDQGSDTRVCCGRDDNCRKPPRHLPPCTGEDGAELRAGEDA